MCDVCDVCVMPAGHRCRALAELHGIRLTEARRQFLDMALAAGSGKAPTGVRWWVLYRWWGLGKSPVPDPRDRTYDALVEVEDDLEGFVVWLAVTRPSGRQISAESIRKYVSTLRNWYRRWHRAELGLGAKTGRIPDILRGYRREVPQPPPLEREGCTPADLAAGMRKLGVSQMWRSALTFAMAAIARGSEIALTGDESFEQSEHLMPSDVVPVQTDGVWHARVRMRKRKDLRILRGKQVDVVIAGGGTHFDAAAELFAWIRARRLLGLPDDGPLFVENGAAITVDGVRDMVRAVMQAAGRDPRLYGAHSLRIGGATAALAAGVPPQMIRLMGRWSSDVYEIYCRLSVQAALSVGKAICSAQVDSASDRAFHAEHLEMLPEEVDANRRVVGDADVGDEYDDLDAAALD